MKTALGKIEPVRLRDIWSSESGDFTPWLAERQNIELLATSVGLSLNVCGQESRVGVFRADILCKDSSSNNVVVIENQLEKSDHGHLGQLLTYACGLKAATIIWVAPEFCKEHRETLDWLNDITRDGLNFFAVKIEVLGIGKERAPRFTIITAPKDWSLNSQSAGRKAKAASSQSESAKTRFEYWQMFLSQLHLLDKTVGIPKPNSLGNLRFSLQGRDLWITVYAAASLGRIGVFLRGNENFYALLKKNQSKIQKQIGKSAQWYRGDDGWSITISQQADPSSKSEWPTQHQWLEATLQKYLEVFDPYAKQDA
jgi:hypothetical protein